MKKKLKMNEEWSHLFTDQLTMIKNQHHRQNIYQKLSYNHNKAHCRWENEN